MPTASIDPLSQFLKGKLRELMSKTMTMKVRRQTSKVLGKCTLKQSSLPDSHPVFKPSPSFSGLDAVQVKLPTLSNGRASSATTTMCATQVPSSRPLPQESSPRRSVTTSGSSQMSSTTRCRSSETSTQLASPTSKTLRRAYAPSSPTRC